MCQRDAGLALRLIRASPPRSHVLPGDCHVAGEPPHTCYPRHNGFPSGSSGAKGLRWCTLLTRKPPSLPRPSSSDLPDCWSLSAAVASWTPSHWTTSESLHHYGKVFRVRQAWVPTPALVDLPPCISLVYAHLPGDRVPANNRNIQGGPRPLASS
nr:uncharacterized protein LOC110128162 isoform X1 [Odocoileus virginianus texanus]